MTRQDYGKNYGGSAPANYEKYFVPVIGGPLARDLLEVAALRPGECVLDVACGTGVVTRLAAERVGPTGTVAGLDVNPGMLAVARANAPAGTEIAWYETGAEAMPISDSTFDVVLCQMGLQFFANKLDALREMRRVLVPDGRLVLNLPGPRPPIFAAMAEALARHIDPGSEAFVNVVFSMHAAEPLRELLASAGFRAIDVRTTQTTLQLPPPEDFLWQYIYCTPMAEVVRKASDEQRDALVREVSERWQAFVVDGGMRMPLGMTTAMARR